MSDWKFPTLDQCKKLIELGVVLETERMWVFPVNDEELATICQRTLYNETTIPKLFNEFIPAPDVAELGKLLPRCEEFSFEMVGKFHSGEWYFNGFRYKTEAQARCAALIWLIENGYLKHNSTLNKKHEKIK